MVDLYTKDYFDSLDWTPIQPAEGWQQWAEYWTPLGYAKIGRLVMLRGTLSRVTGTSTTIATLPVEARALHDARYALVGWAGAAYKPNSVTIGLSGQIVLTENTTGVDAIVHLDGITFLAGR